MSVPEARGNGLSAEAYAALADLHPRVASEMLNALREAGIAAYATPKSDLIDSMVTEGRADTPAVSDRLYVDASMKSRAEQILASRLPQFSDGFAGESADDGRVSATDRDGALDGARGGGDRGGDRGSDRDGDGDTAAGRAARDEETIWAEIVASFDMDTTTDDAPPPWPEEEDLPRAEDDDSGQGGKDGHDGQDRSGRLPTARVIKPEDELLDEDDDLDEDDEAEDEGHFVPPSPPPLPSADTTTKAAWVALFGGPLYLLISAVLRWQVPGWVAFLAVAAFVGGFVTLVLRMGDDPRDPDDGAVV